VIRPPAVAGSFYPADPEKLGAELTRCLQGPVVQARKKATGIVVPHAGYIYSGPVAGILYRQVDLPKRFIILSPNHTGYGLPCSIMPEGEWETPLGQSRINCHLASRFMRNCPRLQSDTDAHRMEHSLEVQLPFLQYLKREFTFVPLTLSHLPLPVCLEIGRALAQTVKAASEPVLIIASSDMNHYENQEIAMRKDQMAIDRILELDPSGLYETVKKNGISMCGIIPTTVMLVVARELGAKKAELVKHATSGDVTGDYGSVVGYASLIVE